jgi:hypothetical protein
VTESEFQGEVVTAARYLGWICNHAHRVQGPSGKWFTPSIDAGFPDLVLAHHRLGIIFAELKTAKGVVSPAQATWRAYLAPHAVYRLWRPADWQAITAELSGHPSGAKA